MTNPSPDQNSASIDQLCINTIRTLSIDAIQKANSGHPGLPLGAAPMAYVLWQYHLKHNPEDPNWADRDRFVLSAGHGSMLIYSLLHLTGYDVSLDDIKNFRQWDSRTPGHPESFITPGVEATTGPLGQGTANVVGMAMAERALANQYNQPGHDIVDHYTYALVGDGDLMEGISAEAASMAGHLKLGKLIMLYDSNDISLDGPMDLSYTEDFEARYKSYGWQVITVTDGNTDLVALDQAIKDAKAETGKPSLIIVKTTIGFGSPNKAGTSGAHGSPLGPDEVALTKKELGWEGDDFYVPEEASAHFSKGAKRGKDQQNAWNQSFETWSAKNEDLANNWNLAHCGILPEGWDSNIPSFEPGSGIATRVSSGQVLNGIAANVPWLIGGDADLSCSTKTAIKNGGSFDGQTGAGRNIHFGVREHAMGAVANGICYHGGLIPYTATFLCFADYMRPAMRLAALSKLSPIFVFTHDSVALGEDGPTHQPVEHVASLRLMPNMLVIRPAEATETAVAWKIAVEQTTRPTTLVFSRQDLPTLDRQKHASAENVRKGAYILSPEEEPQAVLVASGSEVTLAMAAQEKLREEGVHVSVVSMPCWELFAEQDLAYRQEVLPPDLPKLAIEAGVSFGWERWVGDKGAVIAVDRFGTSAPGDLTLSRYGFNVENVCHKVHSLLD